MDERGALTNPDVDGRKCLVCVCVSMWVWVWVHVSVHVGVWVCAFVSMGVLASISELE